MVVILNLCCQLLTFKAKIFLQEFVAKLTPVNLRICHTVGVIVARGTSEFACKRHTVDGFHLLTQTVYKHHQFLAQSCGRCRLTVGVGQHRDIAPFLGKTLYLAYKFLVCRTHHVLVGFHHHHRECRVIYILRSQSEVHQLTRQPAANSIKTFLDKVLHSFHIVVGSLFYILYSLCRIDIPVTVKISQLLGICIAAFYAQLLHKSNIVFNFDTHTIAYQRRL